jgi:hypothetical protein
MSSLNSQIDKDEDPSPGVEDEEFETVTLRPKGGELATMAIRRADAENDDAFAGTMPAAIDETDCH